MTLQAGDIIHNVTSNLYFVLVEKLKKQMYQKLDTRLQVAWKVFVMEGDKAYFFDLAEEGILEGIECGNTQKVA